MVQMRRSLVTLALLLLAAASIAPALAFPDRPVRIVVPYAPGGGNDALARVLAQKLEEQWGKPVVVENRSGGNTLIATEYVGRQPADGYTVLMVTTVFAVNPSLLQKLPYDTLKNFTPVVLAGSAPNVLVTKPALPVNSVKGLIAYGHANPGKLTYGHPGIGTTPHLAVELFNSDASVKAVGVGYRGTQPQLVALLAGEIDYAFDVTSSLNHVQAGKLKGLAVTHAKRNPALPDVPTIAEAGAPGGESGSWIALLAPAGTPKAIIDKVAADVKEAVESPEVRDKLIAQGAVPQASTPAELQKLIDVDRARYGKIIRDKGLKAE